MHTLLKQNMSLPHPVWATNTHACIHLGKSRRVKVSGGRGALPLGTVGPGPSQGSRQFRGTGLHGVSTLWPVGWQYCIHAARNAQAGTGDTQLEGRWTVRRRQRELEPPLAVGVPEALRLTAQRVQAGTGHAGPWADLQETLRRRQVLMDTQ